MVWCGVGGGAILGKMSSRNPAPCSLSMENLLRNHLSVGIVDINTKTASRAWPLLIKALEKADYVSLDLVRELPKAEVRI